MKEYLYLDREIVFLKGISSASVGDTGTVSEIYRDKVTLIATVGLWDGPNYFLPLYRRGELWDFA